MVGDGYPLHESESSSSLIPNIEEPSGEQDGAYTFDGNMLAMVIKQAKAQKEREVQLYLSYLSERKKSMALVENV